MKHQAKKQTRSQHMPVVIVCILILVLAVMGLGMHFIKKYIPTKERMNLTEYYGQPGDGEMAGSRKNIAVYTKYRSESR